MKHRQFWTLSLVVALATALPAIAADEKLGKLLEPVLMAPQFKPAHWGILVVDLASGAMVHEVNADHLFAPASTTKLYSVAAALTTLGADYHFRTPVYRRGEVDANGGLHGDLVLVASGDLSFGGRTDPSGHIAYTDSDHTYANGNNKAVWTNPDPLAGLEHLAHEVAASGIKRVLGDVLVDDRLFERAESTGSGPRRLSPVLVNDNLVDVLVTPTQPGRPASIAYRPQSQAVTVDAQVETIKNGGKPAIRISSAGSGRIIVRGQIPGGHAPVLRVAEVEDPASFARALFIEALTRAGVALTASPLTVNRSDRLPAPEAVPSLPKLTELTSPPFAESVRLILKVSHNLHASTLPLLLAAHQGKRTLAEGLRLERDALARLGVPVETISFGGGAGGSNADWTTPRATVFLLRAMAKRPDFAVYDAGLPVLGEDGTLAHAVDANSPARGKVHAKTGTYYVDNGLNGRALLTSKALAGYLTAASGRRLAFSLVVNNVHLGDSDEADRIGRVLGRICEILYSAL